MIMIQANAIGCCIHDHIRVRIADRFYLDESFFECARVLEYKGARVPEYQGAGVPECRSAESAESGGVSEFKGGQTRDNLSNNGPLEEKRM